MADDDYRHRAGASRRRFIRDQQEPLPHASTYPLSRLAPRFDLVSMAEEIQAADAMLAAVAGAELEAIADQIRGLRARAGEVLERARRDAALHRARCRYMFEGSYRLELDLSWTPVSEIENRDRGRAASRRLLDP